MVAGLEDPRFGQFDPELGIWIRVTPGASYQSKAALFLDRDGVVIEDTGYLCRPVEIVLIPGAVELIAAANRAGVPVVEVTNQSGIGRGYYGWEEFQAVEQALALKLEQNAAAIDAVIACPYHPEGVAPWAHPMHPARKPQPGMLLAAQQRLGLDLSRSWIVGDKPDDLLAGYHAGLRGGMHVLTGQGQVHRPAITAWHPQGFEVWLANRLSDAAGLLELLK
ncbi:MAG: hypothetical protein C5B51_06435 [Terriglobia bacterium]|nr:MAG: hypothetical protein C5B51_06435 [Terriglobia bacterium]